jgi:hypothetical protein
MMLECLRLEIISEVAANLGAKIKKHPALIDQVGLAPIISLFPILLGGRFDSAKFGPRLESVSGRDQKLTEYARSKVDKRPK